MKKSASLALFALLSSSVIANAQDTTSTKMNTNGFSYSSGAPIRKGYWGNSLDGLVFQMGFMDPKPAGVKYIPRFSMFFHVGVTYNYNFSKGVGIYTGLDLKNIGYIIKDGLGDKMKQRVYTLGVPVGLRFGDMKRRNYLFLGGGADLAIHYKEKIWLGNTKNKYSEWFSDRTELLMPYVFVGVAYRATTFKFQYYPSNFLNEDYEATPGFKPYAGQKVNLFLFSIGRDIQYSRK